MPTVAEVLKAANVKEEVVAGLPPEVINALNGYVSGAETTLQTAAQKEAAAAEALRQATLEKQDVTEYVEKYGTALTKTASVEAENKALRTYLESLKTQGFEVQIPVAETAKAVVPGSPAIGANAVDAEKKILNTVGTVMAAYTNANNEHIRLYGTPIPDSFEELTEAGQNSRKPFSQYLSERYKFSETRKTKETEAYETRVKADAAKIVAEERRKDAELRGSNPNLRAGESSRNSVIPIKHEDFEKATGNVPRRERLSRLLDNVHKDVAAARSA